MGEIDGPPRLVLIGPPGVGKGTQSALLERRLGIVPISSGHIFRQEIEDQTELGRLANRYIQHGRLVPDDVTVEMIAKRLRNPFVKKSGFVLDGFPRTVPQAEALDEELMVLEEPLDAVLKMEIDDDKVVERLSSRLGCTKCGAVYNTKDSQPKRDGICDRCNSPLFVREDDRPETIRERLRVYYSVTEPVAAYYATTGQLTQIPASDDPDETYARIVEALEG